MTLYTHDIPARRFTDLWYFTTTQHFTQHDVLLTFELKHDVLLTCDTSARHFTKLSYFSMTHYLLTCDTAARCWRHVWGTPVSASLRYRRETAARTDAGRSGRSGCCCNTPPGVQTPAVRWVAAADLTPTTIKIVNYHFTALLIALLV